MWEKKKTFLANLEHMQQYSVEAGKMCEFFNYKKQDWQQKNLFNLEQMSSDFNW